jgi:ParB family chromosome partitioning protein
MLSSGEISERDGRLLARHHKEHPQMEAADLNAHLKQVRADEAQRREEERSLLQAVKQRGSAASLSADNKQTPVPQDLTAPGPEDLGLLSADNKPGSPPERVPSQTRPVNATADAGERPAVQPEAHHLVQQLGSTSAQRAQRLAEGMSLEELRSLVEELRAYL